MPPRNEPPPLMLSSHQVARKLSVSCRTIWRMVRAGQLVPPVRYSRKLVRWRTEDVERWVREQVAELTGAATS